MPKTFPAKNDFTRGQFSPLLHDRSNEAIYQNGAKELTNGFVIPHGGFTRRGGTRYSGETRFNTGNVNLESFVFSQNPKQSYVLEFGDKYLRFVWGDDKYPLIDPASLDPALKFAFVGTGLNDVTITGTYTGSVNHYYKIEVVDLDGGYDVFRFYIDGVESFTYYPGDDGFSDPEIFTLDGITFTIPAVTGHTIGDYWETEVYWKYTIPTPYPASVVNDLWLVQKEDVILIFHKDYVPRKLSRYGHTDWRLEPWVPNKAPWEPTVGLKYNLYDVTSVWNNYKVHAISKGYLDYYFSESNGASLLKSGNLEDSIAFSLDNTYYSTVDNEFRLELLDAAGSASLISIEIIGKIYIPEDGSYEFAVNNGYQGADLIIDGNVVASRYGTNITPLNPSGGTFQTQLAAIAGTKTLEAGEHTFRARFWISTTNRLGAVYWKKPGDSTFALIPAQYFVEQSERYGVTCATFNAFDLDNTVTLPPSDQAAFDALFTTETSGITVNRTGRWDDRIGFHSQVGMTFNPFTADLPPEFIVDSTRHSLEIAGYLSISEAGNYQFAVDGNDGCEFVLYDSAGNVLASVVWLSNINTQAQTDGYSEWKSVSFAEHVSSVVALTEGVYRFRARYWSELKGFAFAVAWLTPGESEFVLIPQASITPNLGYYPNCGTFHEQRLFVGGSIEEPQTIYSTKSYDVEDFEEGADADSGLKFRISSAQLDAILWMVSKDVLYVGTVSTEYLVRGNNGFIAPDDIDVKANTTYGSAAVRPVKGEDSVYFVKRSEKGIREYTYVLERDKSVGVNVDILGEDLFHDGIQKMVYQQGGNAAFRFGLADINENITGSGKQIANPINAPCDLNLLWVLTQTGELKSFTIEMLEKVYAWTCHTLGGSDVVVDSFTTIPGDGGDILFLAVSRTINGSTVRTIEWIDPLNLCDLGIVESDVGGSAGLDGFSLTHLPGEDVRAVGLVVDASGGVTWEPIYDSESETYDLTLSAAGAIDFKTPHWVDQIHYLRYQAIYAGYGFYCTVETLPFDVPIGQNMTSFGMMKRWADIWLSTVNTTGAKMALAAYPTEPETMEDDNALVTGRNRFFLLGWDREAALRVTQDYPLPLTLRSIYGQLQVNMG